MRYFQDKIDDELYDDEDELYDPLESTDEKIEQEIINN